MVKMRKLLCIVFLLALFLPGYALASVNLIIDHPTIVELGQPFTVTVMLDVNSPPPNNVCGYQYCIDYDEAIFSLVPLDIPCTAPADPACATGPDFCTTPTPPAGTFFRPTCSDDCTAPGWPIGLNACEGCQYQPIPGPPPGVANIKWIDIAGYGINGAPCAEPVPFNEPKLVSTLTFKAIAGVGECFEMFTPDADCPSFVNGCDDTPDDDVFTQYPLTIVNRPPRICIVPPPGVPAFSGNGTVIFALVLAASFILVISRYRSTRRNFPTLLLIAVLCITPSLLMLSAGSVAAQGCPADCLALNFEFAKDGTLTAREAAVLLRCVKTNCGDPTMDINRDGFVDMTDYEVLTACMKNGCICAKVR